MWKFIAVTFGFLGFVFYEMSGGADFVPEERPRTAEAQPEPAPEITADEILAAATGAEEVVVPNNAITIREGGDITLAAVSDLELEGVPARLTQPLLTEEATDAPQLFASLSVSPDGTLPADETTEAVSAAVEAAVSDLRTVDATALNVRSGPSTSDGVIGRLERFEIVTVLAETEDGWAQARIEGDGIEGWVASRFLSR